MQYLVSIVTLGVWASVAGGGVTGLAQGGGSRALQPSDPCLVIPAPPECAQEGSAPDSSNNSDIEVEPLPTPEPAPAPERIIEDNNEASTAPALTTDEEEQVEESTITPLYDDNPEGEAELENEIDQNPQTSNRVGVGLAKLLTLIYLAFTGLGLVVSAAVALVTYFVRRKNGGNTETSFLKMPLIFGCLVVLGGIVYALLNTF